MSTNEILRATGVAKVFREGGFNVEVLKDVYLRAARGEQIAVVGAPVGQEHLIALVRRARSRHQRDG